VTEKKPAVSRYAVLGMPVAHSKSPAIHRQFAEQTGEKVDYEAIEVQPEDFVRFVGEFFVGGGAGLNITLPHKEAAFALAQQSSDRARLAGAANTLYIKDGELCADNTDGPGLVRDICHNHDFTITGKSTLMLGAGGAARGALAALIEEKPGSITLLNRTRSRAEAIATDFAKEAAITPGDFKSLDSNARYDLVINATSLSLSDTLPPLRREWLNPGACCYDMMYADTDTVFVRWAKDNHAALALDGLGMLVEQAAGSFQIWRGIRPDTAPVIAALRTAANNPDD